MDNGQNHVGLHLGKEERRPKTPSVCRGPSLGKISKNWISKNWISKNWAFSAIYWAFSAIYWAFPSNAMAFPSNGVPMSGKVGAFFRPPAEQLHLPRFTMDWAFRFNGRSHLMGVPKNRASVSGKVGAIYDEWAFP